LGRLSGSHENPVTVVVHLHTILQQQGPEGLISRLVVDLPAGSDLAALLQLLEIKMDVQDLLLVVNTRTAAPDWVLHDGDEIHLIPALSGGA
jgi:molybdopterin converting factor small subunit